jgi:hypothetical protein
MSTEDVVAEIAVERQRQIASEGWSPEHDDTHKNGELADAAACYAVSSASLEGRWGRTIWPWQWEFKPKDRRRNLIRAAALIIAEIDRLDREHR